MTNEEKLRAFAQDVMRGWPYADEVEMSDIEEFALKHGLLNNSITKGYEKTPLLTGEPREGQ